MRRRRRPGGAERPDAGAGPDRRRLELHPLRAAQAADRERLPGPRGRRRHARDPALQGRAAGRGPARHHDARPRRAERAAADPPPRPARAGRDGDRHGPAVDRAAGDPVRGVTTSRQAVRAGPRPGGDSEAASPPSRARDRPASRTRRPRCRPSRSGWPSTSDSAATCSPWPRRPRPVQARAAAPAAGRPAPAARRCATSKSTPSGSDHDPAELERFRGWFTINVTEFFRDPDRWVCLRDQILPSLLAERRQLRIWSAGCSHGAEVYSLLMLLDQYTQRWPPPPPRDRHRPLRAGDRARRRAVRPGPAAERRHGQDGDATSTRRPDGWYVRPDLRARPTFREADLLARPARAQLRPDRLPQRRDLLHRGGQGALQGHFDRALRPGGMLFTGATELIPRAIRTASSTSSRPSTGGRPSRPHRRVAPAPDPLPWRRQRLRVDGRALRLKAHMCRLDGARPPNSLSRAARLPGGRRRGARGRPLRLRDGQFLVAHGPELSEATTGRGPAYALDAAEAAARCASKAGTSPRRCSSDLLAGARRPRRQLQLDLKELAPLRPAALEALAALLDPAGTRPDPQRWQRRERARGRRRCPEPRLGFDPLDLFDLRGGCYVGPLARPDGRHLPPTAIESAFERLPAAMPRASIWYLRATFLARLADDGFDAVAWLRARVVDEVDAWTIDRPPEGDQAARPPWRSCAGRPPSARPRSRPIRRSTGWPSWASRAVLLGWASREGGSSSPTRRPGRWSTGPAASTSAPAAASSCGAAAASWSGRPRRRPRRRAASRSR